MLYAPVPTVFLVALLCSCSERYSPFQIDVPKEYRDLTALNLTRLQDLPEAELPITLAAIGDPQGTPGDLEALVETLNNRDDIRLLLVLGDLTDYGLQTEYLWAARALSQSKVPFFTVVGNHDAISHGKSIYQAMFGPFNYTFEDAGLKFIMWNNNQFEFGEQDFTWLKQESDGRSIVASHIPPVVDQHRPEQLGLWLGIQSEAKILGSLHGHRGGKTDFLWQKNAIPYYVVPRVRGVRYSLITISKERKLSFQSCHSVCAEEQTP